MTVKYSILALFLYSRLFKLYFCMYLAIFFCFSFLFWLFYYYCGFFSVFVDPAVRTPHPAPRTPTPRFLKAFDICLELPAIQKRILVL